MVILSFVTPAIIATAYFVAAVLFGLFYFMRWRINSDAFIVHPEMNLRPNKVLRRRLFNFWRGKTVPPSDPVPQSIQSMQKKLHELTSMHQKLTVEITTCDEKLTAAKKRESVLGKEHSLEIRENIRHYKEVEKSKALAAIKLEDPSAQDPFVLQYDSTADPKLRLKALSEVMRIENRIEKYINSSISNFTNTSVWPELKEAIDETTSLLNRSVELGRELADNRSQQYEIADSWNLEQSKRLRFIDFIYFSMGVATTNAFGDMIPNDRFIRFLIIFQLVLSIFLVGLFVNLVANKG